MMKPTLDHTGEVWLNRRITGPGSMRVRPSGKKMWSWRWECIDCGATGEASDFSMIKHHAHLCGERWREVVGRRTETRLTANEYAKTIPYKPPERAPQDPGKLCGKQCVDCGHSCMESMLFCQYILDTGRVRPKVDLRKERCPVRDPNFKRQMVYLKVGETTGE